MFIIRSFSDIFLIENNFCTYSDQICMHPFFTVSVIIESNNLKCVFCNTLLQSSSTLQPKQNSFLISVIPRNKNETVHYVREKILPQISNWKAMGVFWYKKTYVTVQSQYMTVLTYRSSGVITARQRSYCENTHILRILSTNL